MKRNEFIIELMKIIDNNEFPLQINYDKSVIIIYIRTNSSHYLIIRKLGKKHLVASFQTSTEKRNYRKYSYEEAINLIHLISQKGGD